MRKKITVLNSGFMALVACLFFITYAYSQAPCTNTFITSFLPASGTVGTVVTINGNGFQLGTGTSSVKFNGVEATAFTVVSASVIKATVPATATAGTITIITNGCRATGPSFTVLTSNCQPVSGTEIYISELYDQRAGTGGMIELYNPTNNTISLTGYRVNKYADRNFTDFINLTGSIAPESTYLIAIAQPNDRYCIAPPSTNGAAFGSGFNENDKFELLKNSAIIDIVIAPTIGPGFTYIRNPDAMAPSLTYDDNDWTNSQHTSDSNNLCSDLGNHNANVSVVATITTQPQNRSICENGSTTFAVTLSNTTGFTYRWKTLNASGTWVNVTNGGNYSGATTATLTVTNTPAGFNGNQYYCEMTSTGCTLLSNTAQLNITTLPAIIATSGITDCATQTATVTITPAIPASGVSYTVGTITQNTNIFTNIPASATPYNVTVTSGTCSVNTTVTVNAATTLPAAVATAGPTDCATQTATVIITPTTPALGITFTLGTITQTSNVFNNVPASATPYNVTVTSGTCSVNTTVTVNAATTLPAAVATAGPTDCATQTATVTITPTTPALGITFTLGTITQNSNVFNNVPASATPYNVTVRSGTCSVNTTVTVNAATTLPAAVATAGPTDCATQTATVTITPTTPALGITFTLGTITQNSNVFNNVPASATPYNVTITSGSCTANTTVTVNAATTLPAAVATAGPTDCATQTATVTITPTIPALGITFTLGTITQNSNVFNNVPASATPYNVIVTSGSCAANTTVTVNAITNLPQITGVQECRETIYGKNYVLEALPLANSFDVSTANFEWRRAGQNAVIGDDNVFNVAQYALANGITTANFPLDFEVTVITPGGCEATLPYIVRGIFCDIPKGISPDNDTRNDTFNLTGLNVTRISIFNRYGLEVYNRNNYTNEWHGQANNGNELPTGTYFYVVETEGQSKTGWVYLNRPVN